MSCSLEVIDMFNMSDWWLGPRNKRIQEIKDELAKSNPVKIPVMYKYPVRSYRLDIKCSKCGEVRWRSIAFSPEEADEEEARIQAQYKKHLDEFHPGETSN